MATTYYEDVTASDLSLGGSFTHVLVEAQPGSTGSDSLSASSGGGTAVGHYATASGDPSTGTSTGTFTTKLNVTANAAGVTIAIVLRRLNSAGTQQAAVSVGSADTSGTTGVKTFTVTNPALGTWNSGDRLDFQVTVTNTNAHGGAKGATWETGGTSDTAVVPWSTASTVTGGASLTAAGTLHAAGFQTSSTGSSLTGTASLSAAGFQTATTGASLTATGTLHASGVRTVIGGASLTAAATLSASGTDTAGGATVTGGASLSAAANLAAAGHQTATGGANLTATATLSGAGVRTVTGGASLTAAGTLSAAGTVTSAGSSGASLAATGTLSASGTYTAVGGYTGTATAILTASGFATIPAGASLTAGGHLAATGTIAGEVTGLTKSETGLVLHRTASVQELEEAGVSPPSGFIFFGPDDS